MNRDDIDWKGYIPALTTPFTADGALDRAGWQELVEWAVAEGVHGVFVAGSSGEWFSLEPEERIELFRLARAQVDGRVPVLGGCNALRVPEAMGYLRAAQEIGLDGVILGIPPYAVPNDDEIVAFYERAAAECPLPLCLYNWPRGNGVDFSVELLTRLAEVETAVAVKNSTRDPDAFVEGFFAVKDALRVFGFGTDARSVRLILNEGGDGTIGGGAVLGRDHPGFYDHLWAGDVDEAQRCGERDRRFNAFSMTPTFDPTFASCQGIYKAALDARGLPGGDPRPPLLPLTEEQRERTYTFMDELGLRTARATAH